MNEINVVTPVNTMGYGHVGLNILKGLEKIGADPAIWLIGQGEASSENHELINKALQRALFYNPARPCLRIWHQWDLSQFVGKGKRAAYTFFEMDRLRPIEVHHLNSIDLLFVPSHWAKEVCEANGVTTQIEVLPCAVDTSIFRPGLCAKPRDRAALSMVKPGNPLTVDWGNELPEPHPTVFLNCGKWEVRKGHDVLLNAFRKAFTPKDNVRLIMNCVNPFLKPEDQQEWVRYYKEHELGNKVYVVPNRLPTQADLAVLMAQSVCGIFPARAEAWNLEAAEMMAMGKHVIVTKYSGHTEFCNEHNSMLIDINEKEDAVDGIWFNGEGQWAAHDDNTIEQIVAHMRYVHKLKQENVLKVNQSGIDTFQHEFTWEKSAEQVMRHV